VNGAHDLGGKHGFGPIDRSQQENFAKEWEEKVFALTLSCGMLGHWNLDQSRFARENTDPAHYLKSKYFQHWLLGLEQLLLQAQLITEQELAEGISDGTTHNTAVPPNSIPKILSSGAPTLLPDSAVNKFSVDDSVVVRNEHPQSHTRVPSYVKGIKGKVVRQHGMHIYADEHAQSGKKEPQHLYSVRFEGKSLWGSAAEENSCVFVDLFEPYLMSLQEYKQSLSI